MPRKLRYSHDAPIEGQPYSIFIDEETGQQLSIPHAVKLQAALDPISVADRERAKALKATPLDTANFGDVTPRNPEDEMLARRDKLQGVLDTFERNRRDSVLRRRDALLDRPALQRAPATDAGPVSEQSPTNPAMRYDRYSMDRMPHPQTAAQPDDRTYGSFFDELEQLKKQARGGK